jgi:tRNA 2-thiouridine synthesizing protein A
MSSPTEGSPDGVANVTEDSARGQRLDLRGVKCPLNWAHAKVRLEGMRRGEMLDLIIDDPRGVRDIPRAAEAEGYSIAEVYEAGSFWRIRIER